MPVELNDLILKRERVVSVPMSDDEGDTLVVRWNPTRMTREIFARLQEWQRANTAADETLARDPFEMADVLIAPLMTGWDITVDGAPYPITSETISGLGLDLMSRISRAITADYNAAGDTKKDSAAT